MNWPESFKKWSELEVKLFSNDGIKKKKKKSDDNQQSFEMNLMKLIEVNR